MSLGEKLRAARQEAGLSQRALCGDFISRNMLSQIETGAAQPSLPTLQYLADRLGKPAAWFLEEGASANHDLMKAARAAWDAGDWPRTARILEDFSSPDEIHDREAALLTALARLNWAEQLLDTGRDKFAEEILSKAETALPYCGRELGRRKALLLARLGSTDMPDMDEELLLLAQAALHSGDALRAGHLLDASEVQSAPRWQLLRGKAAMAQQKWEDAAGYLKNAESAYPEECAADLEICYRELGNFKLAYEYACKRRK